MKLGHFAVIALWSSSPPSLVWRTGNAPKEPEAMTSSQIKIPGLDHPLIVETNASRVVVSVGGRVIADSRETLTLREAKYPAVQYISRKDVDMSLLERRTMPPTALTRATALTTTSLLAGSAEPTRRGFESCQTRHSNKGLGKPRPMSFLANAAVL